MKLEYDDEIYAMVVSSTGQISFISEKTTLTEMDGDGALTTFAEATFAVALAMLTISNF